MSSSSSSSYLTMTYYSSPENDDSFNPYHVHTNNNDLDESLPVLYTNDPKMVNRWLTNHLPMDVCAIGFDTESVPDVPWIHSSFKRRPATVQLSTSSASLVIPLISSSNNNHEYYSRACVPLLETLLADENIIKCGCGIDDDLLELRRHVPGMKKLQARSRLDLGLLGMSKNRLGLQTLTRILLNRQLEKPKHVIVSDWSNSPLTDEQVAYAARDAWCGAAVLQELQNIHPETFGTQRLINLMRAQPSLKVLARTRQERIKAKRLLETYRRKPGSVTVPLRIQEKVAQRMQVVKTTRQLDANFVESLALIKDQQNLW